jgi:alpha-aminoadipic semialdehyde synthase
LLYKNIHIFNTYIYIYTGNGNVTRGALEVFKLLPHEMVSPAELQELTASGATVKGDKVYGCLVGCEDLVAPLERGVAFDKQDYYAHPHKYRSVFHENIAPHTSVLVNGMYWDGRFPRLLSNNQLATLHTNGQDRLQVGNDAYVYRYLHTYINTDIHAYIHS